MSARGAAGLAAGVAAIVIATTVWLARDDNSDGDATLRGGTRRHDVSVAPAVATVGVNAVDIEVSEPAGVTAVRLEPAMTDMGHAYPPLTAAPVDKESGRYRAEVRLDMPGRWELTVVVDDGTGTERVAFPLTVTG
jgi:hypothetical protein